METETGSGPSRVQEALQRLGIRPSVWERYRPRGDARERDGAGTPMQALRVDGSSVYLEGPIIPADDEWFFKWLGITAYVTANLVRAALDKIEGEATLVINSPGGDVFEASSIVDGLIERRGKGQVVNARVAGLAASAAASLLLYAKRVECSPLSMVMLHRAWSFAMGNSAELTATANLLAKVDRQLAGEMAKRTGKSEDEAMAILAGPDGQDGTWYSASEAVDAGFADAVAGEDPPEPDMGEGMTRR